MYIFDGAMGTMLQAAGLEEGYCPELFNIERPEVVKDIITRIKKEEGLRYADAYGILLLTKEYLEYEANFLSPIFSKKEIE